ncbi:transposase family protein [Streptomyces sp. NPDC051555]|uniref:transposase family protein n=1 Tax=Streptomyces sp. NPDC051555 TaxID=3365657 RepID=UPI00379B1CA4
MSPHQLDVLISLVERKIPGWVKPTGRPHALPLWRAVVVLCFLLRHNNAQAAAAELFEIYQPTVSWYGTRLRPIVRDALKMLDFGLARLPGSEPVLVDGFLAKSWDWKAAERLFSKKHQASGHNIQVVANTRGRLQAVDTPLPGARHDASACRASGIADKIRRHPRLGDKGYQGLDLLTPYKKPPGRKLTNAEKDCNRAHSAIRSAVERCIGHLENWKILGERYRGPLSVFPEVLETVTQLEPLRAWKPA